MLNQIQIVFLLLFLGACANNGNSKLSNQIENNGSTLISDTTNKEFLSVQCDTIIKYDLEEISSEGAEVEACYYKKKLDRATIFIFGAAGRTEIHYWFKDSSAVTVKELNYKYKKALSEIKGDDDIFLSDSTSYIMSKEGKLISGKSDNQEYEIYQAFLQTVPFSLK